MATPQVQVLADTMQVKPEVQMCNLNAVQSPRNLQDKVLLSYTISILYHTP